MIKFWKIGVRSKIKGLEKRFIEMSNSVDNDLLGLHRYDISNLNDSILFYEEEKIERLKEEIGFYERQYRDCFCFSHTSHPNYEKFRARADLIFSMINKELLRRCNL